MDLKSQKCIPCQVDTPKLNKEEINGLMTEIDTLWVVKEDPDRIVKTFKFKNFLKAIEFTNKIADIAETEGHHPNIYIHDYNKVGIELYTHKIKGLHRNDFILASKIEDAVNTT